MTIKTKRTKIFFQVEENGKGYVLISRGKRYVRFKWSGEDGPFKTSEEWNEEK